MTLLRRYVTRTAAAATAAATAMLAGAGALPRSSAAQPGLGQLSTSLSQQQAHQQSLSARVSDISLLITSLRSQIALVQTREVAVGAELAIDRAALAGVQGSLARGRSLQVVLQARLARSRQALARQLVSGYEADKPDVVRVVLEARGFSDLLEQIDFLRRAERQQQTTIQLTRTAKAQAAAAAERLAKLQAKDRRITQGATLQVAALAGMNSLLVSKQGALQQARAAQQAALSASRARGVQLQRAISRLRAEQAAARAAAAQAAVPTPSAVLGPSAAAPGPSGGWAIPYAIVLCESGGQNLPPNSAGASGYYQITPGTWSGSGGSGPAAYLAGKAQQDAVARRVWNGGAGAANWVCAGTVGIH